MNKAPPLFLSFLLFFLISAQGWTAPFLHETSNSRQEALGSPETSVKVATYEGLLRAIRETRSASQQRIEAAVEQEKVREAWETGKLIEEHILLNQPRADYGEQVLMRLSKDLSMSKTELDFMVQFSRTYPITWPAELLSWSHYQSLMALNDPKEREEVTKEAVEKGWNRDQVRAEVRRRKAVSSSSSPNDLVGDPLPAIIPGPLNTYQIIRLKDRLKIDLGFGIYFDLPEKDAKKFKEGNIVVASGSSLATSDESRATDLFTYTATVTQVVDGDTFHALIDLGFGITLAQRVRLRRIDTPEILSAEGKEAKAYLEKILSRSQGRIILQSHDIDQHGRPIADVWVCTARSDKASAVGTRTTGDECRVIDQELLDQGLAVTINE